MYKWVCVLKLWFNPNFKFCFNLNVKNTDL